MHFIRIIRPLLFLKQAFFIVFFFSFMTSATAQDRENSIYSGGMLVLQPGYIIAENEYQDIHNINYGVGGILRFYFYNYFTAGVYGGTQTTNNYSPESRNSYIHIGYGGPFFGLSKKIKKWRYTVSAFIGQAAIKNLHVENQVNNRLVDAAFYNHSAIIFSPVLSIDYALSQKLVVTLQTVCLTAKYDNKQLYNPVLQFGMLFNR